MNEDQTQLLCMNRGEGKVSLFRKGQLLAEKIISPRFLPWKPKPANAEDIETFWLLDLRSNSATTIGDVSQFQGAGSSFRPSPNSRFAFNQPTASHDTLFVCDLKEKRGVHLKVQMYEYATGWWDNQTILQSQTNDFRLLDVVSGQSSPILHRSNVIAFLDKNGIAHQGQRPSAFASWNGRSYDFYITDTHRKWLAAESFLLKVGRPDTHLSLVDPKFQFQWSDHFDETQRYYVYSGRERNKGSDGVFLRDVKTKAERALVEPQNANYHSIPNFYGTNVIYVRSNQLWRIDFNGSNNVRFFPPE